jgi:hypothetical protein
MLRAGHYKMSCLWGNIGLMADRTPGRAHGEPEHLDDRYAALVIELDRNLDRALDAMRMPLNAEQRAEVSSNWRSMARSPLIKQLDALVGPLVPVIAEACVAYNHISFVLEKPKGYNVCSGETVALVIRFGRPESPGPIFMHYPGCEKHATTAMNRLASTQTRVNGHRVFHSVIALADARREIRQQELENGVNRSRRWWPFRQSNTLSH